MKTGKVTPALVRIRRVHEQFEQLTSAKPESISGLTRSENGWQVMVEIVEVRRIPDTASLLATYRVTTDDVGNIAEYERVRRYNRGHAD